MFRGVLSFVLAALALAGDPAPGRSPGPPDTLPPESLPPESLPPESLPPESLPPESRPPEMRPPESHSAETFPSDTFPRETFLPGMLSREVQAPALTVAGEGDHHQLMVQMPEDDETACDFNGDLIVVDADKAAVNVNFTHPLFETSVFTIGAVYQVTVTKKRDDNSQIQGFSLLSLGDGAPRGRFTPPTAGGRCLKSSVRGDVNGRPVRFNWTLPIEPRTRSNVTFRLRYKIPSSSSVFQVNYAFAVSQGCQIWLKLDTANITSSDLPPTPDCQLFFPGHRRGHGLVLELTRLNIPCAGGGFLQFSGGSNSIPHRLHPANQTPRLCGKLEELPEQERRFYFPSVRERIPALRVHGENVFAMSYRLVDYCYNVTFVTRNGTFDLIPSGELQCTFKIYMPYGYRVLLKMELGDFSQRVATTGLAQTHHPTDPALCHGLLVELWDGSSSWSHCAVKGDSLRNIEIESTDNKVVMKVSVRGTSPASTSSTSSSEGGLSPGVGLRFRYRAEPIEDIVKQCSFGWVAIRQFCVTTVESVQMTWQQAEGECNRRGGHLASVRSAQAQRIIDNLLINSPGYRDQNAYWLGASDKTYEGDFRWSDGLPFSYANWFPGWPQDNYYNRQPNDDGFSDQDCVEARRAYHLPSEAVRLANGFMWNDRDCNTANYFLCERLITDEPVEDGWPPECNRTLTLTREQPRASVSSPGFPRQYPDNAECDTEISAPVGYRLVLDFEELVLEKEPFCSYDYLEIIEVSGLSLQEKNLGMAQNSTKTGIARRLCGDWSAKLKLLRYVSVGSKIRLRFVSDYSHHYGGFKARVSMESAMQCADDRLMMFNNSCYLFVSYPEVTWSIAQNICKGMRAQLASVMSAEEERFITTNIRKTAEYRTGAVYWLGSKMEEQGEYKWIDGADMLYSGWLPGQKPGELDAIVKMNAEVPQCLGVQWTTSPTPMLPSGLYWKSKKCSAVGGYVCKRRNQISGIDLNFNRTINGSEGRLTSPNYPGNYYNNLDFLIRIIGPERTRLIIQFSKLDIEPQLECLYDHIQLKSVIRGNGDAYNDAVKWCGNHDTDMERFDFVSETNEAELRFHSDYSLSGSGFSIIWHAVDVSGCPLQTLTAKEGVVASPNYPHFLLARLDCAITILAPAGKRVWLQITDYDMDGNHYEMGQPRLQEKGSSSSEAILELDLGGSSNAFQPFQITGHLTDGAFVSNSERLLVRLRTADKPIGAGFRANYKTVNGIQEERSIDLTNITSGTLLHLNYPNRAPARVDFIQHLVAPIGNVILLELYHVKFSDNGCPGDEGSIDVIDNYADSNGTSWHLCYDNDNLDMSMASAPLAITSYLNTLHIRQRGGATGIPLNGSLRVQSDINYKIKLLRQEENVVETCNPNPCLNSGKCVSKGNKKFCQCIGHFTGLFCALTMCELEPCVFGQCTLTPVSYKCHCQTGYTGTTCEQKQRPCEGNPCEGRGDCIERGDTFHCRCHAWWEGQRCERRLMNIPFRPLSERMLHEPFWLGLITVTIVLAVIGLVWCARRHFPEKLEKLLAEESDRSRCPAGPSLRGSSVREQLSGGVSAAVMVVPSPQPGCQRSLFGRLGIRKPSILSLTSPHGQTASQQTTAAAARTFSLDDLLKPPPRRTPSPRKKRNNSTPTKKNAAEKKQILQQLISPSNQTRSRKVSIGELIQLSERKVKAQGENTGESSGVVKETRLTEPNISSTAQITLTDPKLEKKVTFARLLNKVSAEMSSGSEVELQVIQKPSTTLRPSSTPPSPAADVRSPNSTSSNQGSDSLSSSDLALPTSSASRLSELLGKKNGKLQNIRPKPASADSILAMFRNFSSTSAAANMPSSVRLSPSTTPTASTPQDDVAGDDDSTTSSIHTPVSFSSGLLDSPPNHRRQTSNSTIEVPVLDALSAHKSNDNGSNFLHPPTILLEVPSVINKCLSPIREMPTPLPTPIPTPLPSPCLTPVLQRSNASSSAEDLGMDFSDDRISVELPCISVGFSDDDEMHSVQDIAIDIHAEDGLIQEEAAVMHQACSQFKFKPRPPLIAQTAESKNLTSTDDSDTQQSAPPPLIIPTLTVQQPSPTHARAPMLGLPGSPPPHRASIQESSFPFSDKPTRRLLKDFDKPTSLDLPCAPPLITVTFNMSEAESDAESLSPAAKTSSTHLGPAPGNVGMCYLSPFSMCSRADRTASESNLSSSGYSSMASPGPSRCGSNNPLCPSEMEDPGSSGPSSHLHSQLPRRPSPLLKTSTTSSGGNNVDNNSGDQRGHCRGRSDSETLSDDPLLESNDEGIGTDHIDEKIEDGELKSAKELEHYIGKDLLDNKLTVEMPKLPSCLSQSNILTKCETIDPTKDRLMPPVSVCKVSLQLPSIVVQSEGSGCDKYVSPVSSRSESPLSDRTVGLGRFSPQFYSKQKDLLPFTDSDGLYDFPSSDCAPQNKVSVVSTMQQHRKSTGRKREKKSTRTLKSPTKSQIPNVLHHHHLDVPSKDQHFRVQPPRKPSPKRRARNQQVVSSSSSSESLNSAREVIKVSSSSPSPDTIRWSSPTNWPDPATRRRSHESSGEDTAEESSSVMIPSGVEDPARQSRKISRLRTISHQIRFLRRLEKSLKRRDHLTCASDSVDSGEGEEFARVTSPLLQPMSGPKPEIRKSSSIGKLQAVAGNPTTRFKRGKTKKGGDLLIPQEEVTWTKVLASGNGHSD